MIERPEKTLRQKIALAIHELQMTEYGDDANLLAGDVMVTLGRQFDAKFNDIADWIGKHAQRAITTGGIDNNEAHDELRTILFGEDA